MFYNEQTPGIDRANLFLTEKVCQMPTVQQRSGGFVERGLKQPAGATRGEGRDVRLGVCPLDHGNLGLFPCVRVKAESESAAQV